MTAHSQQPSARIVAAGFLLLALCGLAFAARAQAGEVHFDPESPAGKEYALPLQQARDEALGTGEGEGAGKSGAAAPLFGVGVGGSPPSSGAGHRSSQGGGAEKPSAAHPGSSTTNPSTAGRSGSPPAISKSPAAPASSYSLGQGLLILAGLLLLGVVVGITLRRRGRTVVPG